jgi:hypothetical protein
MSQSDIESDYYKEHLIDLYLGVSSFDDLLGINVKFLNNEIEETYYNVGPFDDDNHREELVKLHLEHRIYTIEMQYLENDNDPDYVCHSSLQMIVEPDTASRLEPLFFTSNQIYTSLLSKTRAIDNYPKDSLRFNIATWTDSKGGKHDDTNWWRNWNPDLFLESSSFHNVDGVLQDCVVFFISVKDTSGPNVLEILHQILILKQ